jgi:hypothetical protein
MKNVLNFDSKLKKFISDTRYNRISEIICCITDCFKKNGDYIEYVDSTTISYIPKSKFDLFKSNPDRKKYAVSIKVGRFITRFMRPEILKEYTTPNDVESFVNEFKSYFECDETNLKIVTGSDVLKYYREENYLCSGIDGTLWKSCMRQHDRNKFLKLYEVNPIQMLIFLTPDDKIRSRALLWEAYDKNGNSYHIMDRIYSIYDHDVNFFKSWAKKNGYYYKYEQTAYNENTFCSPNGDIVTLELKIVLVVKDFKYYPYLDTFKFFDLDSGILYNTPNNRYQYTLVQSDGSLEKDDSDESDDYEDIEDDNNIEIDW